MRTATDQDHKIINAVSVALGGQVGRDDDPQRLKREIEGGRGADKLLVACEIATAFIRWSQDLKETRATAREALKIAEDERLRKFIAALIRDTATAGQISKAIASIDSINDDDPLCGIAKHYARRVQDD